MRNEDAYTIIFNVCEQYSCNGNDRRLINQALETIRVSLNSIQDTAPEESPALEGK